jgi:acetyltransferase
LDDAPNLVDIFENMGSESRYSRFMEPVQNVTMERIWSEAEDIVQGARGETFGLLALVDTPDRKNTPVGGARYVKLSNTQAEFAVSVRDDMQGVGIGTHLVQSLIDHAAEAGIERLLGVILNTNQTMWRLLRKLGYRLESQPEGAYSMVTVHIKDSPVLTRGWPDTADDFSPEPQIIW